MDEIILRPTYIEQIKAFIDRPFVKIITGLRRSGKSELLKMLAREVLEKTNEAHVIFINFEHTDYGFIKSNEELTAYFKEKMVDGGRYYIFLDEIQRVESWEKTVNSIRLKGADIYITGSNSKIMSDELATILGGRTISFVLHPLSFAEFIDFRKQNGLSYLNSNGTVNGDGYDYTEAAMEAEIAAYIRVGGFPALSIFNYAQSAAEKVVQDINSTALLRDVSIRHEIRMTQLLDRIVAFLYDNVGNLVSLASITNYLKSEKRGGDTETIANYLKYLEDAYIIRRAQRYDIKGKKLLETNNKYYLGDHSLRYALQGFKPNKNIQGILENIVYIELLRRGYTVHVGKIDTAQKAKAAKDGQSVGQWKTAQKEIDFVAEKYSEKVYVQVCVDFTADTTREREINPLKKVRDNYPKYVVTLSKYCQGDDNGIKSVHLKDFLLKKEF
ncbi:MAG: ATP-binding protein [Christensenellaceae bacterium]|jgi:predicted AAA+ superfamily ATPase|nr:ATP-binding protein [Christensenellaceae bacterium]